MDKDSTLYKLIAKINQLKEMKGEFDVLSDEIVKLFSALDSDESERIEELVKPYFFLSSVWGRGDISTAFVESVQYYEAINLDSLVKQGE